MSTPSAVTRRNDAVIPVNQSIYEESSTQMAPLGTKLHVGERMFAYAKADVAVVAGDVCAVNIGSTGTLSVIKQTAATAASAGAYQVKVYAASAVAAGVFDDGYLTVQDSLGQGFMYKVKSQPAISSAGSTLVTIYDPLQAAIAATSWLTLTPNPAWGVTNLVNVTAPVAGIAVCTMSAGNYGWLQVKGIAAVKLGNTTAAFGDCLVPSTTGGATICAVSTGFMNQVIGRAMQAGTAYDHVPTLLEFPTVL